MVGIRKVLHDVRKMFWFFFFFFLFFIFFFFFFFFFQAEDGIRDHCVTGVQTCALPIYFRELFEMIFPLIFFQRACFYGENY